MKCLLIKSFFDLFSYIIGNLLMGQDLSSVIDTLNKDSILSCPNCKKKYNLTNRTPIMVCANQHSFCEECIEQVSKEKRCFECKDGLIPKRKKNSLLCYILDKLGLNESPSQKQRQSPTAAKQGSGSHIKRNQSAEITQFKSSYSPERRAIKIKTVKQQSIPDLNLQLYKEEREFRKKYSVASIFSSTKLLATDSPQKKTLQTFEDVLERLAEEYQITPFKNIIQNCTDPMTIRNMDLHLYKIPKIFDVFSHFKALQRLNLTKNKISKIQNLRELKQLAYLSLSQNNIQAIQNLEQLTNLKNLYLNKNRIEKIENLETLTELEFLGLAFNAIQKIQNISHLTQLQWLNLQCNYIAKIQGIVTLKKLEIILLGSNEITVFQGFQNFPALQEIHIENNKINDLGRALSMKHLRKIRLEDNPGLKEDNTESYIKLLQILEAKSKGIQKSDEKCIIY